MNGDSTGLVSADTSSADDPLRQIRAALSLFNATAKAACDLNEAKLQREAEDAAARLVSFIEAARAAGERLSSSEALHGVDPPQT